MFDYILYRVGQFIALTMPLKLSYTIAVLISDIRYIFACADRRAVKENLQVIFPEKTKRQIHRIRIRVFRNFAKYLVDFFRFSKLDRQYIKENIKTENMHFIDQALSKGKGVIAVSAHLGNWELGAAVIALLGYPFWAVALPHKDKRVDNFFNFHRESKGVKVIPLGKAVRKCLSVLGENGVVALVGDRDFTEKGMILDFFDKPALFPEGPAAFAIRTGAAIIPAFMVRNKDDTFTLKMEDPLYFSPSGDRQKDLVDLIMRYKAVIERYIRAYSDQWYMFKKFWIRNKQN